MAKQNSNDKSKKSGDSGKSSNSEKRHINESGKKSYQPTVDKTKKPPKKNGK